SVQRTDTSAWPNVVMTLSLRGDADPEALRTLADDVVVPELLGVEGVAQIAVQGGASRQVAVVVDAERARLASASAGAVRSALLASSLPVEDVGLVEDRMRRMPVVLDGRMTSIDDLAAVRVGPSAVPLLEVADV